jgi:hypothetical protein
VVQQIVSTCTFQCDGIVVHLRDDLRRKFLGDMQDRVWLTISGSGEAVPVVEWLVLLLIIFQRASSTY